MEVSDRPVQNRRINLVGGLCYRSTIKYVEDISKIFARELGGKNSPEMSVRFVNMQKYHELFEKGDWLGVGTGIMREFCQMRYGINSVFALATNTPHRALSEADESLLNNSGRFVHIVDETAKVLNSDMIGRVGLLGTRFVTESDGYFVNRYNDRGVEIVVPNEEDRLEVDRLIWDDIIPNGKINDKSKSFLERVCMSLADKGARGVILGCTELDLVLGSSVAGLKTYDTTKIHAEAIAGYALS